MFEPDRALPLESDLSLPSMHSLWSGPSLDSQPRSSLMAYVSQCAPERCWLSRDQVDEGANPRSFSQRQMPGSTASSIASSSRKRAIACLGAQAMSRSSPRSFAPASVSRRIGILRSTSARATTPSSLSRRKSSLPFAASTSALPISYHLK